MAYLIKFTHQPSFLEIVKYHYSHFNLTKKTVLIIEPYGSTMPFIQRGIENQFNVIILTANKDLRKVPLAWIEAVALAIEVDTANEMHLLTLAGYLKSCMVLHAIIPGFEYFVPVAIKMSRYFNLPSVDAVNALDLRQKDLMRLRLQTEKIRVPKFCVIHSIDELKAALDTIGYPAICKPIDSAGSVNVKRVASYQEAHAAALRILEGEDILWGHKLANKVLIEEYIAGKEYSLEGVVQSNHVMHFSITEKWVSDQIDFIEVGHIVNPPIESQLKRCMENYIESVIKALKINYCPYHAEIRLDKDNQPVLMEIASRLAGDRIGELIYYATGINYYDYCYAAYLNEDLPPPNLNQSIHAGIRFFYRPHIASYFQVKGADKVKTFPLEEFALYYTAGQAIPDFPKPLRRLGHVISKNSDYVNLSTMLDEIDHCIDFEAA